MMNHMPCWKTVTEIKRVYISLRAMHWYQTFLLFFTILWRNLKVHFLTLQKLLGITELWWIILPSSKIPNQLET